MNRIVALSIAILGVFRGWEAAAQSFELGENRFLFLDTFLLDSIENAALTVNPPRFDALVLVADKPWEKGGITSYGNVFRDPIADEYRMYYVPVCWDVSPGYGLALATSRDGRHWDKPNLGVVEWQGSRDNNLVVWAQREGTVLIDPNAAPERRYAFLSSDPGLRTRLFTSPDGIHFTMDEVLISAHHSDSQISSFWDDEQRRYLHYPKVYPAGTRDVGLAITGAMNEPWPDAIPTVMARDDRDPPATDLYTNACQKYALARATYVGFPTPYYHYNEPPYRAFLNAPTLAAGGKTNDGVIDTQLAVSRDGRAWTRYRAPYVPLGRYDGLDVKVAMMIPGILYEDDCLVQFFVGYTFTHGDTRVRYGDGGRGLGGVFRVEQRIDGFVSLDFAYEGGVVVTAPFVFQGSRLRLNLNTSAAGEARVGILDEAASPIAGFGPDEARVINGDHLTVEAAWAEGAADVSALAGTPVRLRFDCRGTKLYSFQFGD